MHDGSQTVTLPGLIAIAWRRRLIIVVAVALAVALSLGVSALQQPTYTARAVVAFNDESSDLQALGTPAAPTSQPEKVAAAQAERITRADLVGRVRTALGIRAPTAEIQRRISTQVEAASNLVTITAKAPSGTESARLANGLAVGVRDTATQNTRARYRAGAQSAERRADKLKGTSNASRRSVYEDQASRLLSLATFARPVDVVRLAEVPTSPSSPRTLRNALLAGLLGLMLGLGVTFLRDTLDARLSDPSDLEGAVDLPALGLVRSTAFGKTPMGQVGGSPMAQEDAEAFRILRKNLRFLAIDETRITLVTSPLAAEGKSTVALGLAWAEASAGHKTLLLDCDLRRPAIAERLGVRPSPGLSDLVSDDLETVAVVWEVSIRGPAEARHESLFCLPAGLPIGSGARLLGSGRFRGLLQELAAEYDRIIIDSAPILPVSDTLELLSQVDSVVMCLRIGQTKRSEALAAHAALARVAATPVGAVYTGADKGRSPYYAGAYAYARAPTAG